MVRQEVSLLFWMLCLTYALNCGNIHANNDDIQLAHLEIAHRNILQDSCRLSSEEIETFYDELSNTWVITDEAISNTLDNDIQLIIDCAKENEIIMFITENVIIPDDTIIINKNLILSYYTNEINYDSDLTMSENKAIFSCPKDKAIFDIRANNVTFSNIEISDCKFSKTSNASPIIFNNTCDKFKNEGTVQFKHMNFRNNKNHLQPACFNAVSLVCSKLEIENTNFEENESGGIVIGNLLPINTFYNVTITSNKFLRGKTFDTLLTTLFKLDTNLVINHLKAENNTGLIFSLSDGSSLEINNSDFENNSGSLIYPTLPACINGTNANIVIKNSHFSKSKPLYLEVESSKIEITDSLFQNINDNGFRAMNYSAIRTTKSDLVIKNTNFYYNTGGDYSAALNNVDSNVTIENCVFFKNNAEYGSALFDECVMHTCNVTISNSFFIENSGSVGGALALQGDFFAKVSNSVFYRNEAKQSAAGIFADDNGKNSGLIVTDSDFIENTSQDGAQGGALYAMSTKNGIIQVTLNNCNMYNNTINNGYGCGIHAHDANIYINGGNISGHNCDYGSGVYLTDGELYIDKDTIINNNSAKEAAGVYLNSESKACNVTINNSILKENNSKGNGAAILCRSGCNIEIIDTELIENNSGDYGIIFSGDIMRGITNINIVNSLFYNNSAMSGGCLTCVQECNVNIEKSEFYMNYVEASASVAWIEDDVFRSNFTVTDSIFEENSSKLDYSVFSIVSFVDAIIKNSTFKNNFSNGINRTTSVIRAFGGTWISNDKFSKQGYYVPYQRLMEARENAKMTYLNSIDNLTVPSLTILIENNVFIGNHGKNGVFPVMTIQKGSLAIIKNCVFSENLSKLDGNLYFGESEAYFDNCTFSDNYCETGTAGIESDSSSEAILNTTSVLHVKNCLFLNNNGNNGDGSAINVLITRFVLENSTFRNNRADDGGSIYIKDSITNMTNINFYNNSGGALYLSATLGNYFQASNLNFESNKISSKAYNDAHGGAILMFGTTNFKLENSLFFNNTSGSTSGSGRGGAISGTSDKGFSNVTLLNCSFISNIAYGSSGALDLVGYYQINIKDTLFLRNYVKVDNENKGNCGALLAFGSGWKTFEDYDELNINISPLITERFNIQNKYGIEGISNNRRRDQLLPSLIMTLENVIFEENRADLMTGSLYLSTGAIAELRNCTFVNNTANDFGSINIYDFSELYCDMCKFIENKAKISAGAVSLMSSSEESNLNATVTTLALFRNSLFEYNTAQFGGGILVLNTMAALYLLENNIFRNNNALNEGGAIKTVKNAYLYCQKSSFSKNTAKNTGGAIDIDIETNEGMRYYFESCFFSENSAKIGGAIHMYEDIDTSECTTTTTTQEEEECPETVSMHMTNVTFVGNQAQEIGGALMTNNPYIIEVECDINNDMESTDFSINAGFQDSVITKYDKNSLFSIKECDNWINNKVNDGYGDTIASYATEVGITASPITKENEIDFKYINKNETNIIYYLKGLKSGDILPEMRLITIDDFGNGPAFSLEEELSVEIYSPDSLFIGSLTYNLSLGDIFANSILVTGEYGNKTIKYDFSIESFKDIILIINLRECSIGEEYIRESTYCNPCNAYSYNLYPNDVKCQPCPNEASCIGNFIIPIDKYWHSSPCSTHFYKCINLQACSWLDREMELYQFSNQLSTCNLTNYEFKAYNYLQCKKGYNGPLCGSCEEGYGRIGSFECLKCHSSSKALIIAFLCLAGCWFLLLSILGIKGNLYLNEKDVEESNLENQNYSTNDPSLSIDDGILNLKLVFGDNNGKAVILNLDTVEIYGRIVTETFKICINYLQITAISIAINVNWSKSMRAFLNILDFIGGLSAATATVSLDCLISDNLTIKKTILRIILSIIWPTFIFIILGIFWTLYTILKKYNYSFLSHKIILSLLVVSYISYINITEYLVRVLYCNKFHMSPELLLETTQQHHGISSHMTNREDILLWLEDTSIECYKGQHRVLFAISLTLIMAFSLGFPLSVMIYLLYMRYKDKLEENDWTTETMGFLYMAYKKSCIFWDSVIMFRKSLIAVIVVLSYPLGGNQQGILSVFVLSIALGLQMTFKPFREEYDILNNCEIASLFVSSITFTSGLLFNDSSSGRVTRIIAAIIIISVNICLFLTFIGLMIYYIYMNLKIRLVLSGKVDESDYWLDVIRKCIKYIYKEIKVKLLEKIKKKSNSNVPEIGKTSGIEEIQVSALGI